MKYRCFRRVPHADRQGATTPVHEQAFTLLHLRKQLFPHTKNRKQARLHTERRSGRCARFAPRHIAQPLPRAVQCELGFKAHELANRCAVLRGQGWRRLLGSRQCQGGGHCQHQHKDQAHTTTS